MFTDIDEKHNQLVVAVEDPGRVESDLRDYMEDHGVPEDALVVVKEGPIYADTTAVDSVHVAVGALSDPGTGLRATHRPLVGGIEILTPWGGTCTLGVIAIRQGQEGFVTASHCSWFMGSQAGEGDGSPIGQPRATVGIEARDGLRWTDGECPSFTDVAYCRHADATWIRTDHEQFSQEGVSVQRGYIAWPANPESTAWNGTTKRRINGWEWPSFDEQLVKVGRTTGRTYGRVDRTCASVVLIIKDGPEAGTRVGMPCQFRASYRSQVGDSGAPVFRRDLGGDMDARIRGIHWGAGGWFSPWVRVRHGRELGSLSICAPNVTCVPPSF